MKINRQIEKIFWLRRKSTLLSLLMLLLLQNACKKADNYYQTLYNQPELLAATVAPRYAVGDTIKLMGRLNPQNNLEIVIGGITAKILSAEKIKNDYANPNTGYNIDSIDVVKSLITIEMGLGVSKTVKITSGGHMIAGPEIEIVDAGSSGVLNDSLKLIRYYTLPANSKPLHCQNGKGNVYLWANGISLIKKDGSAVQIMDSHALRDDHGAFSISTFNSGGVNPQETELYFSAVTTDLSTENASNFIYRLCKYDIKTKEITTLNRTLYARDASKHTLTAAQPFEGSLKDVKIFELTDIYPASDGSVFFKVNTSILTELDKNNNYRYLYKRRWYDNDPVQRPFIPEIINPVTGSLYGPDQLLAILPGVTGKDYVRAVNPDEKIMYPLFDLRNQVSLGIGIYPVYFQSANGLSYGPGIISDPEEYMWGYLPLPGNRLLVLMHQDAELITDVWRSRTPILVVHDAKSRQARRYAPGKLDRSGYRMRVQDQLLNYDEDGMLYMTANNGQALVKTVYQ